MSIAKESGAESRMSRRQFVAGCAAAALYAARASGGEQTTRPAVIDLPVMGEVKPRRGVDIAASPLSVGFETLDRGHFEPEKTWPYMAELGVKWARCQTGWARTERTRGEFDFAWLDEVVDPLRKMGIQPWFNLGYGNSLYTPGADKAAVGYVPLFSDDQVNAWLRYVGRIADHYRNRVRHWEIWNEPNITNFWKPRKPDPAEYVKLVRLTAAEIRQRIPDAVIIGGALAGIPMDYLRRCLDAGMGDHIDKLSYHPYRPVPEAGYDKEVAEMRRLLARCRRPVTLWQGENGCPSQQGGAGALANLPWNETRQAKWLLRRILTDLRLEIELTSYFLIVDLVGYRGSTNHKGLLRGTTYTPKPAYKAYQTLCALFDADTKRADLKAHVHGAEGAHVADFVRNGLPLVAWWYPANLLEPWEPRRVDVSFAMPQKASVALAVIDPLAGTIHRVEGAEIAGDTVTVRRMPLLDYPLLLSCV